MPHETLGSLLRRSRLASGLTQLQVATAIGISQAYVFEVERGTKRLPLSRWRSLVDAVPSLTLRALALAATDGDVTVRVSGYESDVATLTQKQRDDIAAALERAAQAA